MYSVYIIKCQNDYLYVGMTSNLKNRLNAHKFGLSKITKNRRPCKLVYKEGFNIINDAAKREKEIKGWRRSKKEDLIKTY